MSRNITQTFQSMYDAEVKRAYGQKALLAGTVKTKNNVEGKSVFFRKKGKGMASLHIPGTERMAMNVEYNQVECALQDWEAYDYVDKFDMKKVNFNEIVELAEVASDALGLRQDQIIIDALESGYDKENMTVGTSQQPLTLDTLRQAVKKLNESGVPNSDRVFVLSPQQLDDLLNTTEVTSADFNSIKTLVQGEINTFLGLKFIMMASRDEGGLPNGENAGDKYGFIYHKDAVGFALGKDLETEMSWVPDKGAWLVGGDFSAGAVVIDAKGVVAVLSGEA